MKIEIDEELQFQIQALSPVGLRSEQDYGFSWIGWQKWVLARSGLRCPLTQN